MEPLRTSSVTRLIVTAAFTAAFAVTLAALAWAGPEAGPGGCDARCASAAALVVAARPAHTDASSRHIAASHAAHARHHHRHLVHASRGLGVTTTRPQPLSPPRQHPEHRAALPRLSAGLRTHSGSRDGQRALTALPGLPALLTLAGEGLDPDQNQSVARMEGFIYSGRGPPRAGPFTSLPPSLAGGLPLLLLSTAPWPHLQSGSLIATQSRGVSHAAPVRLTAASSYRFSPSLEPLPCCSCANRPEGAVACFFMPSVGGFS